MDRKATETVARIRTQQREVGGAIRGAMGAAIRVTKTQGTPVRVPLGQGLFVQTFTGQSGANPIGAGVYADTRRGTSTVASTSGGVIKTRSQEIGRKTLTHVPTLSAKTINAGITSWLDGLPRAQ